MATSPSSVALTSDDDAVLETLQQKRVALSVGIGAHSTLYNTYVLTVQSDCLQIDELVPGDGEGRLQAATELRLQARLAGVDYRFRSHYLSSQTDQRGFVLHRIERPLAVESSNRRSAHRLALRRSDAPLCGLSTVSGGFLQGDLEDISEGGACVRLDAGSARLEPGSFVLFNVGFGSYGDLRCAGKVRYLAPANNPLHTVAGLSFSDVSPSAGKELRSILMGVQRHNIRTGLSN